MKTGAWPTERALYTASTHRVVDVRVAVDGCDWDDRCTFCCPVSLLQEHHHPRTTDVTHMERWGLWVTLYVKLMHALRRGFGLHLYSVFEGPHEADRAAVVVPAELELHILTTDEISSYVNAPQLDFREASVTTAIARGDVCVGAFKDQQLVAYSWRALRGPVAHTGGWEVLWNPGLVYRYKALTLPEFRGLHLNEALSQKIDAHLAQLGHPSGLSFVDTVNLPSLRSAVRKGRRCIGYAGYFQKFGRYLPFRTAGCRASGFAFRRANSN